MSSSKFTELYGQRSVRQQVESPPVETPKAPAQLVEDAFRISSNAPESRELILEVVG